MSVRKSIVPLCLVFTALTACQEAPKTESYKGKEYVVELPSSTLALASDYHKMAQETCLTQGASFQNQLKSDLLKAKSYPLSHKLTGQVRLLENFAEDIKAPMQAKDCQAVRKIANNYQSLHALNDQNSNHDLTYNLGYHESSLEQVLRVRKDFGYLEIDPNLEKEQRLTPDYQPWTGYWFPTSSIDKITGDRSAFAKFDQILRKRHRKAGALSEERSYFSRLENPAEWEGHCHAWAVASVVFPEPEQTIKVAGVSLDIADQKMLFTKSAELTPTVEYGIRYSGDVETDGTLQDIRPEAFHKLVVHHLKANLPVLIDHDPGVEVWTRPVASMIYRVKKDPKVKNAVIVKAWLRIIQERKTYEESYQLTSKTNSPGMTLEYRLHYEPQAQASGRHRVLKGEWINRSRGNHPDIVIIPNIDRPAALNKVLDLNMDLVDEIAEIVRYGE